LRLADLTNIGLAHRTLITRGFPAINSHLAHVFAPLTGVYAADFEVRWTLKPAAWIRSGAGTWSPYRGPVIGTKPSADLAISHWGKRLIVV
jgi:hypothetical protein